MSSPVRLSPEQQAICVTVKPPTNGSGPGNIVRVTAAAGTGKVSYRVLGSISELPNRCFLTLTFASVDNDADRTSQVRLCSWSQAYHLRNIQ
jgi:hypothetical protein